MKQINFRFNHRASQAVTRIIKRTTARQLSGLTPTERGEILDQILVTRNPSGSSLKVQIGPQHANGKKPAPEYNRSGLWRRNLQRRLARPLRAALTGLLSTKP